MDFKSKFLNVIIVVVVVIIIMIIVVSSSTPVFIIFNNYFQWSLHFVPTNIFFNPAFFLQGLNLFILVQSNSQVFLLYAAFCLLLLLLLLLLLICRFNFLFDVGIKRCFIAESI
jgi:hypothetical protein